MGYKIPDDSNQGVKNDKIITERPETILGYNMPNVRMYE